jgi:hypothetical protein
VHNHAANPRHVDPYDGTVIAPGTQGKISFKVQNDSEVRIKVSVKTADSPATYPGTTTNLASGNPAGIVFCHTASGTFTTFSTAVTNALNAQSGGSGGSFELGPKTTSSVQSGDINLYWQWPFSPSPEQDAIDTDLGVNAASAEKLTIPLLVHVEQVD